MAAVENYLVSIAEDVHLVRVCSYLTFVPCSLLTLFMCQYTSGLSSYHVG